MTRILVHSPCGGCGVTTVAANLGVAIARSGYPTLAKGHSIAQFFANWQPVMSDQQIPVFPGIRKVQVDSQLYVSSDYSDRNGHYSRSSREDSAEISDEFIVVESMNSDVPSTEELLHFQFLIVVINPEANSFIELASLLKALCQVGKRPLKIKPLVVLNNYNPESLLSRDIYSLLESSLPHSFYADALLSDESVREALACGIPLTEHAPYSPVSQVLSVLAENLIQWSEERYAAA